VGIRIEFFTNAFYRLEPVSGKDFYQLFIDHLHPFLVFFLLKGGKRPFEIIKDHQEIVNQPLVRQSGDRFLFFCIPFAEIVKIRLEILQLVEAFLCLAGPFFEFLFQLLNVFHPVTSSPAHIHLPIYTFF
jgi:NADH:ubiquinone oxidoreductase subunit H